MFASNARKHAEQTDLRIKAACGSFRLLHTMYSGPFRRAIENIAFIRERIAVDFHVELGQFSGEQRVAGGIDYLGIDLARMASRSARQSSSS